MSILMKFSLYFNSKQNTIKTKITFILSPAYIVKLPFTCYQTTVLLFSYKTPTDLILELQRTTPVGNTTNA